MKDFVIEQLKKADLAPEYIFSIVPDEDRLIELLDEIHENYPIQIFNEYLAIFQAARVLKKEQSSSASPKSRAKVGKKYLLQNVEKWLHHYGTFSYHSFDPACGICLPQESLSGIIPGTLVNKTYQQYVGSFLKTVLWNQVEEKYEFFSSEDVCLDTYYDNEDVYLPLLQIEISSGKAGRPCKVFSYSKSQGISYFLSYILKTVESWEKLMKLSSDEFASLVEENSSYSYEELKNHENDSLYLSHAMTQIAKDKTASIYLNVIFDLITKVKSKSLLNI